VRRFPTTNQTTHVNVDGRLFEFVPKHDYNLLDNPVLYVGNPKSIEQAEQNYPGVFFLGTICHSATAAFVKSHLDEGVAGAHEVVHGVHTIPVSWAVAADQVYSAFHGVPNPVQQGGVLRLYIAPQLGFAVPRATYETVDGFVATEFDAYNFEEVAPGIFFPRKARIQEYQPRPSYYQNYEIKKIENINGEVPHQEFSIDIPAGTEVTYVFGRKEPITFTVGEQMNTDDLENALAPYVEPQGSSMSTPRRIMIAFNAVIIAMIVGAMVMRARQH